MLMNPRNVNLFIFGLYAYAVFQTFEVRKLKDRIWELEDKHERKIRDLDRKTTELLNKT